LIPVSVPLVKVGRKIFAHLPLLGLEPIGGEPLKFFTTLTSSGANGWPAYYRHCD